MQYKYLNHFPFKNVEKMRKSMNIINLDIMEAYLEKQSFKLPDPDQNNNTRKKTIVIS